MLEQRLVVRLLGYWERVKKEDAMPDFRRNNPAMIEDLWGQCFILAVIPPIGSAYKYEYLGDKLGALCISDITGKTFDAKNKHAGNSLVTPKIETITALMELKTPQEDNGQMPTTSGKLIKYRTILLPFGNETVGITHMLGGVSYREF
jgi:hypothetical protein